MIPTTREALCWLRRSSKTTRRTKNTYKPNSNTHKPYYNLKFRSATFFRTVKMSPNTKQTVNFIF